MKKGEIKEEDIVKISITAKSTIDLEEVNNLEKLLEKKRRRKSN